MTTLIPENDIYENMSRANAGQLPIVFTGTNDAWYNQQNDSYVGSPRDNLTYFGYSPEQAETFAVVTSSAFRADPILLRADLEELKELGLNIIQRDNEWVVKGKIPKEFLEEIFMEEN